MSDLGRWLIVVGVILVIVGAVFLLAPKLPWLGQAAGGHQFQAGEFQLLLPVGDLHPHQHHLDPDHVPVSPVAMGSIRSKSL